MPIVASDIKFYGAVNAPENDTAAAGGAIRPPAHASGGRKVEFTDIAATDTFQVLSDGADTRTATVHYRLSTGVMTSEGLVLNGTTPVTSAGQAERIQKIVLSAKDAARTVILRRTTGATTIATLGLNYTESIRLFIDSASAGSEVSRYQLIYAKNEHGSLTLLNAKVKLSSDPQARITIGLEAAKGDAAATANRITAPAGVSFFDDSVEIDVPGTTLAAGEWIGIWVKQTLPTSDPAFKNTLTIQVTGNST